MKNSFKIFFNDLNQIRSNWLTLVVISGLIFLPSLYAWFNISASWDPYGQTDQLPVGIVNEDEGTIIRGEELHVGDGLIETLQENDSMDWHFYDRDFAMDELEKGRLFAVIITPDQFSERLGSVIGKEPKKAVVDYYVNEKINAIAPKITEKGASVIVDDISKQFTETVNGIIFALFNDIGIELEKELPNMERFEQYIFDFEKRLPDIHDALDESLADATRALEMIESAQEEIPSARAVIENGLEIIDEVDTFLTAIEEKFNDLESSLDQGISEVEGKVNNFTETVKAFEFENLDFLKSAEGLEVLQDDLNSSINSLEVVTQTVEDILETKDEIPDEQRESLEESLQTLDELASVLNNGKDEAAKVITSIEESEQTLTNVFADVDDLSNQATEQLTEIINTFENQLQPAAQEKIDESKNSLKDARSILEKVETNIPELEEILSRTETQLKDGEQLIVDVLDEYPFVYEKTTQLADNLRKIQDEADIHEIIELLQNDPDQEKSFLAEPVLLNENKMFPIENYGSGMTPFYTILSLWVGGLLLISLLSTEVVHPNHYAPHEIYFGKLLIFLLIGCLQTTIVTLGDIFLLEVKMANPVWFVFFGIFCSVIFMTLIYTFVALLGNVGKALAIIMLVLQIAGSGGTYPVALLPKFFQTISPFLPFTYAVGLMREAIGGIVWSNVLINLTVLTIIGLLTITIGAILKRFVKKLADKFAGKTDDSGLFQ